MPESPDHSARACSALSSTIHASLAHASLVRIELEHGGVGSSPKMRIASTRARRSARDLLPYAQAREKKTRRLPGLSA